MNQGFHRLVHDRIRNCLVPVSEAARGRSRCASGSRTRARRVAASLAAAVLLSAHARAADLPVPGADFVGAGAASHVTVGNTLTVNQVSDRAILNWQSFDIAAGHAVQFNQPGVSSVALNRIFSADPSVIAGALRANGQIYMINQNGILFANGSQINVGGLVASTLGITDEVFQKGLLSIVDGSAAFAWQGSAAQFGTSFVRVAPGADIRTAEGGRVLMFAPRVENAGRIETPGGQVILAAGARVYLEASTDARLRGLLVEVDPLSASQGGTVTNQRLGDAVGEIVAQRGNVTLAGLAVNQNGRVTATTTVSANGSIYLLARDTTTSRTTPGDPRVDRVATRAGTLTLGDNSLTQVLPDTTSSQTSVDAQAFSPSQVVLQGNKIRLGVNAAIVAPAGDVSITALRDPASPLTSSAGAPANGSRIFMDTGARIDVSGVRNVEIPVERNIVRAELRGNELRDSPVQRDGVLKGRTVFVDARVGTTVADVSGYLGQVRRGVEERSSVGGSVSLVSEGDVVIRQGASIDVSGGSIQWLAGDIATTRLISNGRVYDIGTAPRDLVYEAAFEPSRTREAGYVEGRDAGTIRVSSRALVLDGTIRGQAVVGPRQLDPADAPLRGRLVLGDEFGGSSGQDFRLPDMILAPSGGTLSADFLANPMEASLGARAGSVIVSLTALREGGFGRVGLYSNGLVRLPLSVSLPAGGALDVRARRVELAGDLVIPGGAVSLASAPTITPGASGVVVAPGVLVDVAGRWSNDPLDIANGARRPAWINGGSITLESGQDVTLGAGSRLDVSGGARLASNGRIVYGKAGSISLDTNVGAASFSGVLTLGGTLLGQAAGNARGGTLRIGAGSIRVGGTAGADELGLETAFFQRGGFSRFELAALAGFSVAPGVAITPVADSFELRNNVASLASGVALRDVADTVRLPVGLRDPVSIRFAAPDILTGTLLVGEGATIRTDPGGSINLSAGAQLTMLGSLYAPGGTLSLAISSRPGQGGDPGFQNTQSLWIGEGSTLSTRAVATVFTDARGYRSGTVPGGGSISLVAGRGYLVVEEGAVIDVRGTSATLDLPVAGATGNLFVEREIRSGGGSIALESREGILFDGTIRAAAGGPGAAGGSLRVTLDRRQAVLVDGVEVPYPTTERRIELFATGTAVPVGLDPGEVVPNAQFNGVVRLAADRLAGTGLHDVALVSEGRIRFNGEVSLSAARSITLDAPVISGAAGSIATVSAPYVAIGNANPFYQGPKTGSTGTANLTVRGSLIDVLGATGLQGFQNVGFESAGDIRLRGVLDNTPTASRLIGSLTGGGTLEMKARQVYGTTLSEFTIDYSAVPGSTVRFSREPGASEAPLSAGSTLSVRAARIEQDGVLRAPIGSISLDAPDVVLGAGSVTSVSADGRSIPFGKVENGRDWLYDFRNRVARVFDRPPEKRIELDGTRVTVANGAVVDLGGGGDLLAYEFVPGLGGSSDYLGSKGVYALLPSYRSPFAPFDFQYSTISDLRPGDQITLAGGGGLAGGTYTLLPGHYALLPGAFVVRRVDGYGDLAADRSIALPGGGAIVAGTTLVAGTGVREQRTSGWLVEPGAVALERAQYNVFGANKFFTDAAVRDAEVVPRLPRDAGQLITAASATLALDGELRLAAGAGGRGGLLDVVANRVALLADGASAPAGFLGVRVGELSGIGAQSILIGGTRSQEARGTRVTTGASEVVVDDAGQVLSAGEIVLVASNRIQVTDGSSIRATGSGGPYARDDRILVGGDGAFLRVSSDPQLRLERSGTSRTAGVVEVGALSRLEGGAVELDGTLDTRLSGTAAIVADAVGLGASRVIVGPSDPAPTGLTLTPTLLQQLSAVDRLLFRGYDGIDFARGLDLGTIGTGGVPAISSLTFDAPVVRYTGTDPGTVQIRAGSIEIRNTTGVAAAAPVSGPGVLVLDALRSGGTGGEIVLREGAVSVSGFSSTTLRAAASLVSSGTGSLATGGDLAIVAGRLVGTTTSVRTITAGGALVTTAPSVTVPGGTEAGLASRWTLSARSVDFATELHAPSGTVAISATSGEVVLRAGARIDAVGTTRRFDGVATYTDGGSVAIDSSAGITLEAGSVVDVSAPAGGGNAGALSLRSANAITVGPDVAGATRAVLAGSAGAGRGGRFMAEAGVSDSDAFVRTLSTASRGGFDSIRATLSTGNLRIDVPSGESIRARDVAIAVDGGSLEMLSAISAAGGRDRAISLWARDDLVLAPGVRLGAGTTQDGANGGSVTLGSSSGFVRLGAGSGFDVAGGDEGKAGSVSIRVLRTASGTGVQLEDGGATATGAGDVSVEAVRVYAGVTTIATRTGAGILNIATVGSQTATFMASADAIRDSYAGLVTRVRPGVEVRSTGDLTLTNRWDLYADDRPGGEPGVLTLRAAGNLRFNAALTDGFDGSGSLASGTSWSYRLAGGSRLGSADPLGVLPAPGNSGDVVLASGVVVRTGTGSIDVAAARDFRLTDATSVIYTAGRSSGDVADFVPPESSAFPLDGGRVAIAAGRDVIGAATPQLVNNWLFRQGTILPGEDGVNTFYPDVNTAWWIRFDRFRQNVGALGGGDVSVSAGRDVTNLSVMLPTTGRVASAIGTPAADGRLTVNGGGDLDLRAGRDIAGGQYFVAAGGLRLDAGGGLVIGSAPVAGRPALYPILQAADTRIDVRARGDLNIESIFNPTVAAQRPESFFDDPSFRSSFFTYSPMASARLQSLDGDVVIRGRTGDMALVAGAASGIDRLVFNGSLEEGALGVLPGTLRAAAFNGDVRIDRNVILYPSSRGDLELFADGNVVAGGLVNMADLLPSQLAQPLLPSADVAISIGALSVSQFALAAHGPSLLHAGDPNPVRIVAQRGDVIGGSGGQGMSVPKSARVIAGRDVVDFFTLSQNLRDSEVTLVQAGRDVIYSVARSAGTNQLINNFAQVAVAGPGRLEVLAGRDIDLGTSAGVVTLGNSANSQLPERGADIRLLAGTDSKFDATRFVTDFPGIRDRAGDRLAALVREALGQPGLSREDAFKAFVALDQPRQRAIAGEVADGEFFSRYLRAAGAGEPAGGYRQPWVAYAAAQGFDPDAPPSSAISGFRYAVLFPELRASGRAAVTGGATPGDYRRGFDAIALSQLGGAWESVGDLNLIFSQVKTQRGGAIELLAPGGGANVGLATLPVGFTKGPDSLGILSVRGGDVRTFVRDNFNVNQSRVFTLEGGDILVWSSRGDIDAGRGAKTAISVPPPVVRINASGELVVEFPGAASGSGIGVLLTRPDIRPGDVDLIAPRGTVNAGDAGIRAAGNLTIAAVRVVGAENIQVGGTSAGVPVQSSGVSAGISGVGNVASEASKSAERATQNMGANDSSGPRKSMVPSFITVEVIGLGDEDEERRARSRTQ